MMITLIMVYGIIIGSFLNVLIYRIPLKQEFVKKRSHCMSCGYQLRWYDLIPLLSWLQLRGKCRSCKAPIAIQYPLIELLNGVAYLGIYLVHGLSWWTLVSCMVFSILLTMAMIDLKHMIIPNGLVISLLVVAIAWVFVDKDYMNHVIGFFSVSLFLVLMSLIFKGGMGMGDIKLMAASGLLLGWQNNLVALMIGAIIGSIIGLGLIGFKVIKRKQPIPFGPFLATGIFVSMLFGDQLVHWYLTSILKF